ncbi:hypothetical protein ABZP36_026748 [Zizania latifolia]
MASTPKGRFAAAEGMSKLLKEKRFWVASFLVAWAAALQVSSPLLSLSPALLRLVGLNPWEEPNQWQGHMMWMQRQDAFKHKFGNTDDDNDSGSDSS